ncbi:MAG: hypothetical protein ABRQ26_13370 [Syntrophomonadaceae bacterium]
MRILKFNFLALLLALSFVFSSSLYAIAASSSEITNSDDIKSSIETQFQTKSEGLNLAKENYGLRDGESFSTAKLGDGVPFFRLSQTQSIKHSGYIFPIIINNRSAGIVVVEQYQGKWQIFDIVSDLSFDQDIKEAANQIRGEITPLLVYDPEWQLYALIIQNQSGDELIPVRDSQHLGIRKYEKKPLVDIINSINEINRASHNPDSLGYYKAGGAMNNSPYSPSKAYLFIVPVAFCAIAVGYAIRIYKRRQLT